MALSQKQLKVLQGMPGIDQKLVSAYKKGGSNLNAEEMAYVESKAPDAGRLREITSKPFVSVGNKKALGSDAPGANLTGGGTLGDKDASDTGGVDQVDRFNKFSTALNTGIDMARQQRKDAVLDQVGGMAPTGALPASSFAGVLNSFNNSAAPIEASLLKSATDFAKDSENEKKQNQNAIRELALNVATETGDTAAAKVIAALAEGGDIDAAIEASLAAFGDEYARNEAGAIVKKGKNGGSDTTVFESGDTRQVPFGPQGAPAEVPFVDYSTVKMSLVDKDMAEFMPDVFTAISQSTLKDDTKRKLFNDWLGTMDRAGVYIPADQWLKEWLEIEPGVSVEDVFGGGGKKSADKKEESTDEALGIPQ